MLSLGQPVVDLVGVGIDVMVIVTNVIYGAISYIIDIVLVIEVVADMVGMNSMLICIDLLMLLTVWYSCRCHGLHCIQWCMLYVVHNGQRVLYIL